MSEPDRNMDVSTLASFLRISPRNVNNDIVAYIAKKHHDGDDFADPDYIAKVFPPSVQLKFDKFSMQTLNKCMRSSSPKPRTSHR